MALYKSGIIKIVIPMGAEKFALRYQFRFQRAIRYKKSKNNKKWRNQNENERTQEISISKI